MKDTISKLYTDLLNHGYSEKQAQLFLGRCVNTIGNLVFDELNKGMMNYMIYGGCEFKEVEENEHEAVGN